MIQAKGLCKGYAQGMVLSDLSFELANGDRLAVVGPSGCGKTTLLRLLAGFELPDRGEIFIAGRIASRPGWGLPPFERRVGFAFQNPALWSHMTCAQNILFGANGLSKQERNSRLEELGAAFRIENLLKRYPGTLSGGEARRVGLARALAPKPPLLLLDEPLTNLDRTLKDELVRSLLGWIDTYNPTVIFVTHDAAEANAVASRQMVLERAF